MKKLLAIAALFAAMIFTGCSKDDDGSTYSGDFIGSWELVDTWTNSNGSGGEEKEVITFSSNGTLTIENYWTTYDNNGNIDEDEYYKNSTTYTYNDGVFSYKYIDSNETATGTIEVVGDYLYVTFIDDGNDSVIYTRVK